MTKIEMKRIRIVQSIHSAGFEGPCIFSNEKHSFLAYQNQQDFFIQ